MSDLVAVCRALRVWRHGKPVMVRLAAETVIYHLHAIASGRATPIGYAALAWNIDQ
jgi:hypothetical protein